MSSLLRLIFCRSSLQTVVHPSSFRILLFLLLTSAVFFFCCALVTMLADEHHRLPLSHQDQQTNQFISSDTSSRSRTLHYVGEPVPRSEHPRDPDEVSGLLLKSRSTRITGELRPDDERRPKNSSNLTSSAWLSLQSTRKAMLRRVCEGLSRSADRSVECGFRLDGLLIDRSNHILYCAIPKVASSSVKLAFASMTGQINQTSSKVQHPVHLSSWLRSVGVYSVDYLVRNDPRWLKSAWSSLRKFIIVRHPFERLVSAYVDKFTLRNKFSDMFQHRYGRQIVQLYRNRTEGSHKRAADVGHDVQFSEFVRFLIDRRIRCSQKLNPHWMSFVDVCHPCLIDYDYIVHFERLHEELLHLWKTIYNNRTNLDEVLFSRNVGRTKTSSLVTGYMDHLPAKDFEALNELFSIDFKMFGFT